MIPKLGSTPLPIAAAPAAQPPPTDEPAEHTKTEPGPTTQARLATSPEDQIRRAEFLAGPTHNCDDEYWAAQPPAVQALRDIDDPEVRQRMAGELMGAGYKIDFPIMVWGWGAQNTMQLRQAYGYTWVPHAMQAAIKIAPGLTMPGVDAYDPNNPPPDSIVLDLPPATPPWFYGGESAAEVESDTGEKFALPAQLLSTSEQALAVKQRLSELGLGDLPLSEQQPAKPFRVHWDHEPRRAFAIGGINVGLWMDTLASAAGEDEMRALLKKAWHGE